MEALGLPAEIQDAVQADAYGQSIPDDFVVDPDNWPPLEVFLRFQTQWRQSFSGATGLDYTPLLAYVQRKFRNRWESIFDAVQLIERGALDVINKQRERAKSGQRV